MSVVNGERAIRRSSYRDGSGSGGGVAAWYPQIAGPGTGEVSSRVERAMTDQVQTLEGQNKGAVVKAEPKAKIVELIQEARKTYNKISNHANKAFDYAIQFGEILVEIKADTKHSEFNYKEALKRIGIPQRTANRYTTIVENRQHWPDQDKIANMATSDSRAFP